MSNPRPYLPPDLLDCVVDPLFDERETLRQCCLVSKSWVPHTRKYLFADIRFQSPGDLKAWKKTFPDPANSPAHHTRTLLVGCLQIVTAADVEEGGWIRTFHNVVRLEVWSVGSLGRLEGPLVPFHNFSPALKSLRMVSNNLRCSQVFDLICSLPLLEDLSIMSHGMDRCDYGGTAFQPSTSPVLNGVLVLFLPQGVECATRRLFGLPNGLHFRKLMCTWWLEEDLQRIVDLLAVCSDTLECVDIECFLSQIAWADSIKLSKATKLKQVVFRFNALHIMWITMALQTITSEHRDLQQILFYVPPHPASIGNQETDRQWMDLDRLLVQLWESHAIRTGLVYNAAGEREKAVCEYIKGLLPEITERGIVELVESVELYAPQ